MEVIARSSLPTGESKGVYGFEDGSKHDTDERGTQGHQGSGNQDELTSEQPMKSVKRIGHIRMILCVK